MADGAVPRDEPENRDTRFQWQPGDLQVLHVPFEHIFKTGNGARDKYLSRLFGLFSEDVVRYWGSDAGALYEDLGRPTLYEGEEPRGNTLDFTLRHRGTDEIYIAEMKCELEYEGHKYLRLENPSQIDHHRSIAFRRFLDLSRDPDRYVVKVHGEPVAVAGTILVWGATSNEGRSAAMERFGFTDVLSIEVMLQSLRQLGDRSGWAGRVAMLQQWSNELFDVVVEHPLG